MQFRVMSYNIHKCIGSIDRKYRPERIVETIRHYQPDIVLLQEVDKGVPRSRHDNQVKLLANNLDFKYSLFQANVKLKYGCYGNAILSHYPLSYHSNIDLTVPPKKKRRSLATQIKIKSGGHVRSVKFINVHLGLAAYERKIQVTRIVNDNYTTSNPHKLPIILGGDFNDLWQNLCRKVLYANDFTPVLGKTKTFPSILPSRALDRIFYRGDLEVINSFAGHIKLARAASDHLPIITDFYLPI
ncbi:MAG: endonuclease/exonuclease/phosphatase family protein [Gammaproteobacteria bacterium]|nr:endonuclease/exonuclease/phosphatase family protein [Gammaproteobacteria bacterium]